MHPTLYPRLTLYSTYPILAQLPYTATPHPKKEKAPASRPGCPVVGAHGKEISNLNTSTPTPRLLTTFLILPTLRLPQDPRRADGSPLIYRPREFEKAARQTGFVGHF